MLATRKLGLEGLGMNCPGDSDCPGYVEPGSEAYQNSLLQEILANQGTPVPAAPSSGFDLMGFFNKYGTVIGLALTAAVVLPHLASGGRR